MEHIKQISAQLAAFQVDAMLVTSPINQQYALDRVVFTGAVLVTPDAGWYISDGPLFQPKDPALTIHSSSGLGIPKAVAGLARSLGLHTIGFEEQTMPWSLYQDYMQQLPCELVPAQNVMARARLCKTAEELDRLRVVQAITDQAFLEVLPSIHAGLTEHDVAGMLASRMLANGGFTLAFPPIVASGPNGSDPHGFASDRVIQSGDFVTMDFGCIMDGYGSDMTRTVAVGQPTEEMKTVYNIVLAAQTAGIEAAHSGVLGREIDAAGRKVISDAGYGEYFTHGFGHGLGVEGHEGAGAGPNDTIELPAGAVVSAEPGIYIPGRFGVRIEDLIVLTETGCENLNHSTKELLIL